MAAAIDMDRQEGIVAEWSPRGFGFIHFNDGRRAYVHNSACGGAHLEVGETVTALTAADAANPGKWAAHDVQRISQEEEVVPQQQLLRAVAAVHEVVESTELPQQEAALDSDRLQGVVTEWNPRGFGFVQFTDGRRAYVHNSQCGGEHLAEGESISAFCVEDQQNPGKWAAAQVQRDSAGEEGVVTEWREEGGFGFLTVSDGRRAYVHRSAFGGKGSLYVGMKLRVVLKPDPRNPGKWCAARIFDDAAAMTATALPALPAPAAAAPAIIGAPPAAAAPALLAAAAVDPAADSHVVRACTVTEWDGRGYGFVQADDGRRAFVHSSSCGGDHLQVDEIISANIVPDPQNPGKWAAINVQRGTLMVGEDGLVSGEQGTVAEWNDTGGYGFLNMDDGRRAYIHRNSFGGKGALTIGSKLMVTTKPDPRNPGKWSVDQVKGQVAMPGDEAALLPDSEVSVTDLAQCFMDASTGLDPAAAAVAVATAALQQQRQLQQAPQAASEGQGIGGAVTDWNEGGGYGFLSLDDGRRAYIHRNAFGGKGGLAVGARLQVTTKPDPRNPGKWCVGQVVAGLSSEQLAATSAARSLQEVSQQGQVEEGVVSEWKEEGGYGFLSMLDGRRAYIHRNAFGGAGSLTIGLGLQVTLKPDPRNLGKWSVGEVVSILAGSQGEPAEDPPVKRPRTA